MAEENLGTAVLSIVVDTQGLEASLNKAKQQIQRTSKDLQRSLTAAPVNPLTGRTFAQDRTAALRAASLQRQADLRSLQTAGGGGGGLTSFLKDVRAREEAEKRIAAERAKGYKQADFAERTLQTFAQKRLTTATREQRIRAQTQRSQISGVLSSAVIGGAFPLLFGQGGGAATGGLIGGLFGGIAGQGGGFAGSLAGTLIGQQLDVFNQLAKALQDPVANFQQLVEGSNLSSRALERYIEVLIESGRTAEAEAAIRADISRTIDPTTLAQANAANDQYARTIADVQERLGTLLSGPASQFVTWLDSIVKRIAFLPAQDQGPISAQGRQQLSLANRGAGTALGLSGIAIAGLSAVTGFFPGVLAGGALAAAGGGQFALGESQQEQIALSKILYGAQQQILTVEQKRIKIQKDLTTAIQKGNTETQKELEFEAQLADIDARRAQAKVDFLARDLSTLSVEAYRLQLTALDSVEQREKANEDRRKRTADANKQLSNNLTTLKLNAINQEILATQALASAEQGVTRNTLSTVQAISAGIAAAQRREQELGAQISAARQIGDEKTASDLVNQQAIAAQETKLAIEQGALALKEAGEKLAQDAKNARDSLRSAKEGAFSLLRRGEQLSLLRQARSDIREAGVFDPRKIARLSERELVSAGSSARAITQAQNELDSIEEAYSKLSSGSSQLSTNLDATNTALVNLASITQALADKNWNVNVTVQGGQASTYGDLVNSGLAP